MLPHGMGICWLDTCLKIITGSWLVQPAAKCSVCSGFQMVETLYNNGANSIWEHSLLDPASVMSGRRKASPQDKVQ